MLFKHRLTSRRSQPPLALSVPLSRFTSRVGGGSAFFVRHRGHALDSNLCQRPDSGLPVATVSPRRLQAFSQTYFFKMVQSYTDAPCAFMESFGQLIV